MYKNIIFDFDGTIADSFNIIMESLPLVLAKKGIPLPDNFSQYIVQNTDLREILRSHKLWIFKLKGVETTIQNFQLTRMDEVKLYDGIEKLFQELINKGYRLYVVSTNTTRFISKYMEIHDLKRYFIDIKAGGTVFGKAAVIRAFMRKNKLKKEETIYIGDEERDIKACRDAGLKIISVSWGYKSYDFLKKYNPDYLVQNINSLKTVLLQKLLN